MMPNARLAHTRIPGALERLERDLAKARKCVIWLIAQGHAPTHIDAGDTAVPIVWVEPGPACIQLKRHYDAVYYRIDGIAGGRIETWVAEVMGCRVQWMETRVGRG